MCVALHHWYFNPRLREGGDRLEQLAYIQRVISIHASAREATLSFGFPPFALLFQSTPPRGRRQREIGLQHRMCSNFNPRLREGGDQELVNAIATNSDFNPRLREGGDSANDVKAIPASQFQSTPPRGRRHLAIKMLVYLWRFQSTPPRGRRRIRKRIIRTQSFRFQSTPPRGRRPLIFVLSTNTGRFQSTPPRGRRPFVQTDVRRRSDFNPRLREGGDAP